MGLGAVALAALAAALAIAAAPVPPAPAVSEAARAAVYPQPWQEVEKLASRDPLEFLRVALRWSDERLTAYTCRFEKQEKIDGTLRKTETMHMKFRTKPFSVYLKWTGDISNGQEVIYVDGQYDNKAVAHPSGLLGVLFRKITLDPLGKTALKHSRRPLTNAGMANMLRLIIPQCEKAKANGDLQLTYEGQRDQEGRPAYVVKRVLPHKDGYPCPILVIYVDREWLACVRTDAFDWDASVLSQYVYADLSLSPGLTDADFDPENREYSFRLF
jgi:hypothetical protein